MKGHAIAQAALMAITAQNVTPKAAPLSTATHTGMVIDRNITIGETVGLFYNSGDTLLRMGDVPSYSGNFWVDENNLLYTVIDNKLVVKDGLSGEVKQNSVDAYDFVVAGDGTCCAIKLRPTGDIWCVILPDGSRTEDIYLASDNDRTPSFGYRNGFIGICQGTLGSWNGVESFLYTSKGEFIYELDHGDALSASAPIVLPINEKTLTYTQNSLSMYLNYALCSVVTATIDDCRGYDPWDGYNVWRQYNGSTNRWLGADQSFVYVQADLFDEETGEYMGSPIGRISIGSHYVDVVRTESDVSYGGGDSAGTIIRRSGTDGNYTYQVYDLEAMQPIYTDVSLSLGSFPKIRQNDGYIWIDGNGVYQKRPNGWLMYPTSEYDKTDMTRIYGYSIRNTKIGQDGKAIVLFE